MIRKFNDIKDRIDKLIRKLEGDDIEGPIPLLEEASAIIDQAIEEYSNYECTSDDDGADCDTDDE